MSGVTLLWAKSKREIGHFDDYAAAREEACKQVPDREFNPYHLPDGTVLLVDGAWFPSLRGASVHTATWFILVPDVPIDPNALIDPPYPPPYPVE